VQSASALLLYRKRGRKMADAKMGQISLSIDSPYGEKLNKELAEILSFETLTYGSMLEKAESPIERLLVIHLYKESQKFDWYYEQLDLEVDFYQQYPIDVGDKKYRADFMLYGIDKKSGKKVEIVIECDGHEFHEKTKEQAARDKSRDRDIQGTGAYVIRFSGSEIWKNPSKCAKEAFDILKSLIGLHELMARHYGWND
jgi:very-short-patch-repair endonuclease